MPGHAGYAVGLLRSRCSRIHRCLEERRATPPPEDAAVASATTVLYFVAVSTIFLYEIESEYL